ncbi:MAG: nuclear transport factor 2 family protein [Variovorax sp.]
MTSTLEDLERRVERLEGRAEIAELASAYAIACDEHDMPRLESLFTEDAVMDSPSKMLVANGRKAIMAMYNRVFKTRGPGYHWTHDHFVEFDAAHPDRATGLVLSHAETCPNGEGSLSAMRYNDDYRKVDGRWLFEKRVLRFLYYVPAKDYAQVFNQLNRITMGGANQPADYPEALPAWQAFHGKA